MSTRVYQSRILRRISDIFCSLISVWHFCILSMDYRIRRRFTSTTVWSFYGYGGEAIRRESCTLFPGRSDSLFDIFVILGSVNLLRYTQITYNQDMETVYFTETETVSPDRFDQTSLGGLGVCSQYEESASG